MHMRLRTIMFVIFCLVASTPLAIFWYMPVSSVSERAIVNAEESNLRTAKNLANRLEGYTQDIVRGLNSVILEVESTGDAANFGPLFYTLGIRQVCQVTTDGNKTTDAVASNPEKCPQQLSDLDKTGFDELLGKSGGDAVFTGISKLASGDATLRLVQKSQSGKLYYASVSPERIRQVAGQAAFDQFGHAFVLDRNARVVSHPDETYQDKLRSLSGYDFVLAAEEKQTGTLRYNSEKMKTEMIGSFAAAGQAGLTVFVAQPTTEIRHKTVTVQYGVLGVLLFGLAMAGGFAVIASQLITAPIVQMVEVMNRIGKGELRAYEDMRHGLLQPVEFNSARSAIRAMSEKLRDNIDSISQHAYLDGITGLPNRECFRVLASEEIERLYSTDLQCAILFLDLDGFKQVNDLYGHRTGDDLLKVFATRLHTYCSQVMQRHANGVNNPLQVMPARLGGDEFVVLISRVEHGQLVHEFSKGLFHHVFGDVLLPSGLSLNVNGSVGGSLFPEQANNFDELIRLADIAMYQAKNSGKGRFVIYDPVRDDVGSPSLSPQTVVDPAHQ